jgi:hypothetical protein
LHLRDKLYMAIVYAMLLDLEMSSAIIKTNE